MSARAAVIVAAQILAPDGSIGPGALVVARGRVAHLARSRAEAERRVGSSARRVDAGDVLLVPAFVDAHAHLELSAAAGAVSPGGSFADWIRGVIAWRMPRTSDELRASARAGARRLLETGTAVVGDVDSCGAVEPATRDLPITVRRFREALDAGDPARTSGALDRLRRDEPKRARMWDGLSPHAPYTISSALWAELARRVASLDVQVTIHFAETREEGEWLEHGTGPLAGLLAHAPRRSGLDAIESAGLLGPRTLLVHGNHVPASERARVAASGAHLAHCPGTHAYFGRERFDARAWLDAGVPLCLGTDSRASNDDLDMGRELRLFAEAQPDVSPARAFACATSVGAAALGFGGRAGTLAPGAWAALQAFDTGTARGNAALEEVVFGRARRVGTWIGSRAVAGEAFGNPSAPESGSPRSNSALGRSK